jgi:hypothetical protein
MELEEQDDVIAGFLIGVDIKDRREQDGTIKLTQVGLTKRIIARSTLIIYPSSHKLLVRDLRLRFLQLMCGRTVCT